MSTIRLGDLLVKQGVLTPAQRDAILIEQKERGRPFGALAEEMYGVCPEAVEGAWAEQYAAITPQVDPRRCNVDPEALQQINRRQAWQFRVLPLAISPDGELLVCSTRMHLARAMKFAGWRLGHSCQFVLAEPLILGEAMMKHYPMAGMTPAIVAMNGAAV